MRARQATEIPTPSQSQRQHYSHNKRLRSQSGSNNSRPLIKQKGRVDTESIAGELATADPKSNEQFDVLNTLAGMPDRSWDSAHTIEVNRAAIQMTGGLIDCASAPTLD
eukprot:COSAG02_NODE_245_length_27293_cov_16.488012_14_plen_109_part_00